MKFFFLSFDSFFPLPWAELVQEQALLMDGMACWKRELRISINHASVIFLLNSVFSYVRDVQL